MKVAEMNKDDVGLEIGEGYVTIGMKLDMPADDRVIPMVHTVELTPDKANELGKKLQRYAEIARSIAPTSLMNRRILCMSCRKGHIGHADKFEVGVNISAEEFARLHCDLCGQGGGVELVSMPHEQRRHCFSHDCLRGSPAGDRATAMYDPSTFKPEECECMCNGCAPAYSEERSA